VLHKSAVVINTLDSTHAEKINSGFVGKQLAGGVTAINVTCVDVIGINDFSHGVYGLKEFRRTFAKVDPERTMVVRKTSDIPAAKKEGKLGVILGMQDLRPIEDNLDHLEVFHELGLRIGQLTYNRQNLIGCGCAEPSNGPLSLFGRQVVRTMNDLGIVVDLAHVGERTALDAIEVSSKPLIFSHCDARGLRTHFRNITDACLKAVAAKGGVVGVAAMSRFLVYDCVTRGSNLDDWLRHLDYMVEMIGPDHVGIGLDVGQSRTEEDVNRLNTRFPEFLKDLPPLSLRFNSDLNTPDKTPKITEALVKRGYSEADIRNILGLNFLRVFEQVWG